MLLDSLPPLPSPLELAYGSALGARVAAELADYQAAADAMRARLLGNTDVAAVLEALDAKKE